MRRSLTSQDPLVVAVTGADGFIGRHVVEQLLATGHHTIAITRSENSSWPSPPSGQLEHLVCEIPSATKEALIRISSADVCIHLAWSSLNDFRSVAHLVGEMPAHFVFLERLLSSGLTKLVVAGTCLEYGMRNGELSEASPTDPVTPYGLAKDVLRRLLAFLQVERPYSLAWARLFYLFGECEGRSTLYMQLRNAVARGDETFPMSGGEQLRDYLHVREVAQKLILLAYLENPGLVNVCSGNPTSVRSLVEGWIRENAWHIEPKFGCFGYPDYEPMAFWGSTAKFEHLVSNQSNLYP